MTIAQSYTLLAFPEENFVTMRELSERMSVANSTMTRMIDQLVRRELVHREASPDDRRVVRARLTAAGLALRGRIAQKYRQFFETMLKEIPAERHEQVIQSLELVAETVTHMMQQDTD